MTWGRRDTNGKARTSPEQLVPKTLDTYKEAGQGGQVGVAKVREDLLTCDEGPRWHLAVIGACGGQGPYGCGAEGCPVPRRCGIRPRGKGLEWRAS